MSEETSCWKCQSDVLKTDNFCRECGAQSPGQYMSWDWKESPDLTRLNPLLKLYGCRIEELETNRDENAVRIVPL